MAEAERVVIELLAKTDQLNEPVKQSATQFDASMNKIVASATKAEAAVTRTSSATAKAVQRDFGAASQAMNVFGRDMVTAGDLLGSSRSPFVVPVREGPKVASAMSVVARGAGLMGGIFETVATGGVALLAYGLIELVSNLGKSNNEIDEAVAKLKEHYEQTRLNEQAQAIFDRTVEGSIQKMHALTDELGKQNLTLEDNINLKKSAIGVALLHNLSNQAKTAHDLRDALTELNNARQALNDVKSNKAGLFGDEQVAALLGAQQALNAANAKVRTLTKSLQDLNGSVAAGRKGLQGVDFPLIEQRAKDAVDPLAAINHHFDQLASNARQAGTYTQAFAEDLEKQRKAALDAAEANKKLSSSSGEYGRKVGFADAAAIARTAGLTVTSAQRTTAQQAALYNNPAVNRPGNPVARPGTSAHEGINGKWALDIAFAPGLTAQRLKKIYGDKGVSLSAVYKEAGHFHIEGRDGTSAVRDNSEQDAQQEMRREQAYQNEKASADADVLQARQALATSAQEIANFEALSVITAANKYEQNVNALEEQGKLLPAEAQKLREINDEREKLRLQLVQQRLRQAQFAAQEENFQRGRDFQTARYDAEAELLQSEEGIAKTASQRREIEQRLIDLQFQEERLKNQYVIDWAERVKANADATEKEKADAALAEQIAQGHQATIDQRQSNAKQANAQQNATPLQDYFKGLDDLDTAFQQIAVHGLQTFNDALTNAIVNFTSLKDVGRAVLQGLEADLIQLALKLIEQHALALVLGSSAVAAQAPLAAATTALWAGPAALVSLATFGANSPAAIAGMSTATAAAFALGSPKALGGRILGPGGDTTDRILTPSSRDEYMIRAQSARSIGYDALDYINATGRLPAVNPSNGRALGPSASPSFADFSRLERMLDTAIRAMPSITLHPVVDSGEVVSKGVKTQVGSRAVIAHVGDNASHYKAQLGKPGS
jgi:hypothetical protein